MSTEFPRPLDVTDPVVRSDVDLPPVDGWPRTVPVDDRHASRGSLPRSIERPKSSHRAIEDPVPQQQVVRATSSGTDPKTNGLVPDVIRGSAPRDPNTTAWPPDSLGCFVPRPQRCPDAQGAYVIDPAHRMRSKQPSDATPGFTNSRIDDLARHQRLDGGERRPRRLDGRHGQARRHLACLRSPRGTRRTPRCDPCRRACT